VAGAVGPLGAPAGDDGRGDRPRRRVEGGPRVAPRSAHGGPGVPRDLRRGGRTAGAAIPATEDRAVLCVGARGLPRAAVRDSAARRVPRPAPRPTLSIHAAILLASLFRRLSAHAGRRGG